MICPESALKHDVTDSIMYRKTIGIAWVFFIYYPYHEFKRFFVLFITVLLLSCSHHIAKINEIEATKLLPFIQDGITSKQDVINRLGRPIASYEGGRIFIYFMADRGEKQLEVFYYENEKQYITYQFQLVLVFDPNNLLERHSLVSKR